VEGIGPENEQEPRVECAPSSRERVGVVEIEGDGCSWQFGDALVVI
jgi:hypothetical protein